MRCSSMNHTEGGWPRDVKTEHAESRNKFIRKVLKEDMFRYTTDRQNIFVSFTSDFTSE